MFPEDHQASYINKWAGYKVENIWRKSALSSSQLLPCRYMDPILFDHQNFQEKMEIQNVTVISPDLKKLVANSKYVEALYKLKMP